MKNLILITFLSLFMLTPVAVYASGDHGHEEEGHEHGEEEGHHEEGTTKIQPDHAAKAGIELATAAPGIIHETITLTGSITLNRDTTANVRARFPGIVRDVSVKLGQSVEKGQTLARIESNESLNTYEVISPVSGVVLKRNTNIGDVSGDEELFTIADLSHVWAKFHIFPKDTVRIQEGQSVQVHTLDNTEGAEATIKLLLPTADEISQTHIAITELENDEGKWRPGMTVEGDVEVTETKAAIVVSKAALQTMEEGTVVFVTHDNSYEARPVTIGKSDSNNVEILSGLKAGEAYVSNGSFIVKADIMKSGAAHEH